MPLLFRVPKDAYHLHQLVDPVQRVQDGLCFIPTTSGSNAIILSGLKQTAFPSESKRSRSIEQTPYQVAYTLHQSAVKSYLVYLSGKCRRGSSRARGVIPHITGL